VQKEDDAKCAQKIKLTLYVKNVKFACVSMEEETALKHIMSNSHVLSIYFTLQLYIWSSITYYNTILEKMPGFIIFCLALL